jgi:alpha-2-macroglobulin
MRIMLRIWACCLLVLLYLIPAAAAPVVPEIEQRAASYLKAIQALQVQSSAIEILRKIKVAQAEKNVPRRIRLSEELVALNPESFQSWLQLANAWKDLDSTAEKGLAAGFKAYGYGRTPAEQVEALLLMTSILRTQLAKYSSSYQEATGSLNESIRKIKHLDETDKAANAGLDRDNPTGEIKLTEQAREAASRATEEALQQISRVAIALDEMYKDISSKLPSLNVVKMQAGDSRSATFAPLMTDDEESRPRVTFRNADGLLRACIGFTQELKPNSLSYRDAIKIQQDLPANEAAKDPGAKKEIKDFGVEAKGRELCLTNLKAAETYQFQLLSKLASKQGGTLASDTPMTEVKMPDLPRQVAFSGRNFILPAQGPGHIPLRVTNLDRFELELFRITDRLIHRHIALGHIGGTLPSQEYQDLRSKFGERLWSGTMVTVDSEKKTNQTLRAFLPARDILKDRRAWLENRGSGEGSVRAQRALPKLSEKSSEDVLLQSEQFFAGPETFEASMRRPLPGVYALVVRDTEDADKLPDGSSCSEKCERYLVQWFVDTDIGLTFYEGDRDFTVVARSLQSGAAKAKTRIELVSVGNRLLMSGETEDNGVIKFPKSITQGTQSNALVAILAQAGDDFSFLTYGKERLDLSRLNVDGRPLTIGLNAFVATDRGLYQPGESVYVMALVRDSKGAVPSASDARGLVVRLESRDRTLDRVPVKVQDLKLGGVDVSLVVPRSARAGSARVIVAAGDADDAPIIGEASVQFGPVRPDRARLDFGNTENDWRVRRLGADTVEISGKLKAQYLFGTPRVRDQGGRGGAAGELKAEVLVRIATADSPQRACYEGFSFGLFDDKPTAISTRQFVESTDSDGNLDLKQVISFPSAAKPIAATIEVTLLDAAGPLASKSITLPVADDQGWVGISKIPQLSSDASGTFGLGADLVWTAAQGANQTRKFGFKLQRESELYVWEQRDGSWQHMKSVQRDNINIKAFDEPISLPYSDATCALPFKVNDIASGLESGRYVLTVEDKDTGRQSSVRFQTGTTLMDPDQLEPNIFSLSVNKPSYRPGEPIEITGQFPFDGPLLLAIADGDVRRWVEGNVKNQTATIKIDAAGEWAGKELYVLATLYRSDTKGNIKNGPARAIGVANFAVKSSEAGYVVSIQPQGDARTNSVQPGARLAFKICVAERSDGTCSSNPPSQAFAVAYVVDEGLLSLTGHHNPPPNPENHFFGRKRLALKIMDNYERLLLREGGDRPTRLALSNYTSPKIFAVDCGAPPQSPPAPLQSSTVAPLILVGGSAVCEIPSVDLSNGAVSIFAVVWSADYAAASSKTVNVRAPVVAEMGAPPFLYSGDSATLPIRLENLSFDHGDFRVRVTSTGPVKRMSFANDNKTPGADPSQTETGVRIPIGERATVSLNVETPPDATGKLSLRVSLEAINSSLQPDVKPREWTVDLRPPALASVETVSFPLQRQAMNLGKKVESIIANRYDPKSVTVTARFSDSPQSLLSAGATLSAGRQALPILDQLVWRGMLVLNMGEKIEPSDQRQQISRIIGEIQALQLPDGSFVPYRALGEYSERELNLKETKNGDKLPNLFRTASVLDFLSLASSAGYDVPGKSMTIASRFVKSVVEDRDDECSFEAAYAVRVLVNLGMADRDNVAKLSFCRNAEMDGENIPAKAASAAAYAKYGLSDDAKIILASFAEEKNSTRFNDLTDFRRAMMLEFLIEAGAPAGIRKTISESLLTRTNGAAWSEGAAAWIARSGSKAGSSAASKLAASDLTIGGQALGLLRTGRNGVLETGRIPYDSLRGPSPVTVGLKTDSSATGFVTVEGILTKPGEANRAPAGSLKRRFFDFRTGSELSLESAGLKTGDRLVIVLEGTPEALPSVQDKDGNEITEGDGPFIVTDLLPSAFQVMLNTFPLTGKGTSPLEKLEARGDLRSIHTDGDRWVGLIVPESKKASTEDASDQASDKEPAPTQPVLAGAADSAEFRQAYLVRVNFSGKFTLPALSIEPTVPPIKTFFSDRSSVQVEFGGPPGK